MFGFLRRFRGTDVAFICTASVDEAWVRSTALECSRQGMGVTLLVCDRNRDGHRQILDIYKKTDVKLVFEVSLRAAASISASAIVTASSGLTRDIFPTRNTTFVHMPHSLASLHMVYPENAFNGYDYLFAAGPHHIREFRAISLRNKLKNKGAVPIGYGKLDNFRNVNSIQREKKHVLIAPSWGEGNLLDRFGPDLAFALLKAGWAVTIRPHPLFFLERDPVISQLFQLAKIHEGLVLESSLNGDGAIHSASVMIGDYSGTSFEFAAFSRKPVISVNVPPKIVNRNWLAYEVQPIEISLRHLLGPVLEPDIDQILETLKSPLQGVSDSSIEEFLFDEGAGCAVRATEKLMELIG